MTLARHQLSAYSPLSFSAVATSASAMLGGATKRFGELLRARFDALETVTCDSGTSALQLALRVAVTKRAGNRLVALPAFTCFEVGAAAVGADVDVVLYDVDPETLGPDLDSLRRCVDVGASCVVVAPLFGIPVDWESVVECVAPSGAVLIEDAAQGHGAFWRGLRLGSLSEISVVSFGRGKGWTGAGGGALMLRAGVAADARHDASWTLRRELRSGARALLQWTLGRPSLYGVPASIPWLGLGETRYHEPTPVGALSSYSSALLMKTVDEADDEADTRRRNAEMWQERLGASERVRLPSVPRGGVSGQLRFPVQIENGLRAFAQPGRARRLGVAQTYPSTLAGVDAVAKRLRAATRCPGAESLVRNLITLPTHRFVTATDRDAILSLFSHGTREATEEGRPEVGALEMSPRASTSTATR
jgi:perosamine synthetase